MREAMADCGMRKRSEVQTKVSIEMREERNLAVTSR